MFGDIKIIHTSCSVKVVEGNEKGAQSKITRPETINSINLELIKTIDTKGSDVCGCVLLPDRRTAFSCYNNDTVSVFDANGKYQFETKIRSAYATTFSKDTIYISTGQGNTQEFIEFNINSNEATAVSCNTFNYGVMACGNTLIFCAKGKGVSKMNLTDGSVTVIVRENLPDFCYVTEIFNKLYYTSFDENTVTCCGNDGQQLWRFKNDFLECPMGMMLTTLVTYMLSVIMALIRL